MSSVYLVRHGQAGSRQCYDQLSPLGRRQARLLGEHFVREGVRFEVIWAGAMLRQRQTAEEVWCAYRTAGVAAPEIVVDPAWNEFDLDGVLREMAPRLVEVDPEFRKAYEELQRQMADAAHPVHHSWSPCDMASVIAWIEGRFAAGVESWAEFRARVLERNRAVRAAAGRPRGGGVYLRYADRYLDGQGAGRERESHAPGRGDAQLRRLDHARSRGGDDAVQLQRRGAFARARTADVQVAAT